MDRYLEIMCKACISITKKVFLTSSTQDFVHMTDPSVRHRTLHEGEDVTTIKSHHQVMQKLRDSDEPPVRIRKFNDSQGPSALYNILLPYIKSSIGNCVEYAYLCGLLLSAICERDSRLKTIKIYYYTLHPGDHGFCLVQDAGFNRYVIDAWKKDLPNIMSERDYIMYVQQSASTSPFFQRTSQMVKNFKFSKYFNRTDRILCLQKLQDHFDIINMLEIEINQLFAQRENRAHKPSEYYRIHLNS